VCALILLLGALAVAGCGGPPTGDISGKVIYQGKALPGGYVNFTTEGPGGRTVSGEVGKDGSYSVQKVPVGEAKVTVQGIQVLPMPAMPPSMKKGVVPPPEAKREPVYVPPKYGNADKSGLTYTVKNGPQTYDVELK